MASANETALARNLLNSVLALAFPEHLVTDAAAQTQFLAQLPQVKAILLQQNVFGLVGDSKALDKFQTKLFHVIDQPPSVLDKHVRAAAFELQLIVVQQCAMEQLEVLTPKLIERVIKTLKYQQDGASNPTLAPALEVAAVVMRNIELLTAEVRRELYDSFSKLMPAILSQLQALGNKKGELTASDVQLWVSGLHVFTELLEVSPNSLRIYATKIEQVCVLMFQSADELMVQEHVYAAGAKCLGLLANASDKTPQLWKQIVERTIEMAHLQVDLLSGKRSASQMTAMKGWVKDTTVAGDALLLSVYHRAELVLRRLTLTTAVLSESMTNRSISEREVQLVLNDVIALTRRALSVRVSEIGKQTAVSEDGFRLPSSVVYGILPRVQALALRILTAGVSRAGLCALRHASKIIKVLKLASENASADSHDALYATISGCVCSLGASTVEKLGVPLLEDMVARCKRDLDMTSKAAEAATENNDAATAIADKKGRSNNNNKGKKRKRQAADAAMSQLSDAAGASLLPFVSSHHQQVRTRSADAALVSIATCVSVYGSLLPTAVRSAASEIALFAVEQRAKQRIAASAAGSNAVALLLLTDAVSADASGAHATNLIAGLNYWRAHARHQRHGASLNLSTILPLVALNAGEALLHPRAPPLSITFQDAEASKKSSKTTAAYQLQHGYSSSTARSNGAASGGVRGAMDWDNNDDKDEEDQDEEADGDDEPAAEEAAEQAKSPKKRKVEEDATANVDEEEDEDDDEFEDERPVDAAAAVEEEQDDEDAEMDAAVDEPQEKEPATSAAKNEADDDDDDEFPDIVVDDEDDE
uniref:Pre-rRNA-processing protein RIX1 N-terminal domain-containing protein n=1 Tax=Globisporangium ultimum (strain ATCC 200006 / CBS 805.95 / DAOM BR144) TaxID=431595 RepID=K3X6H5_GLOUD